MKLKIEDQVETDFLLFLKNPKEIYLQSSKKMENVIQ